MAAEEKRFLKEFGEATTFLKQRDYHSLADLVKGNVFFAKEQGQAVVGTMYHTLAIDSKPFDYGWQLSGDQLQILAYAKKAGAPIGQGDITVRFEYVARIEKEGKSYLVEFPDLMGSFGFAGEYPTLKEVKSNSQEGLAEHIGYTMLCGHTVPQPKYQGRKTKKVRPFSIKLTLNDIVVEDRMTAKEAAELQEAMHSRDPNDPNQI